MLELFEKGSEAAWLRSFSFGVDFRPRFSETDALGHVSNVVYPVYIELSRLDYLRSVGDPEFYEHYHFRHVTAEIDMRLVAPCYFDEPLRVLARMSRLGRSSGIMEHAIVDAEQNVRVIAQVAIVSSDGHRTVAWTDRQRVALESFEGHSLSVAASR